MSTAVEIEAMMRRGAGRQVPEAVALLYREAFAQLGVRSLRSRRPSPTPVIAQALMVAQGLRSEDDMLSRPLAERIADAYRAALQAFERAAAERRLQALREAVRL